MKKGEAQKGSGETKKDTQNKTKMPFLGGKTGLSIKTKKGKKKKTKKKTKKNK